MRAAMTQPHEAEARKLVTAATSGVEAGRAAAW
jgi:hypothetical protein